MPEPIYTADNIRIAYELRWSLAVFWKQPAPAADSWLTALQEATEPDGVRVLEHRLAQPDVSQFLVSTKPHVAPADLVRSIKGRLQRLVRASAPKAFRRNYSIHSIGDANQAAVEKYVAEQLAHHPMADPRVEAALAAHPFSDDDVDLGQTRRSSHGEFIYNLHLVAVHAERQALVSEEPLGRTRTMLKAAAKRKEHLLSRAGLLADHVHWTVGCGMTEAPVSIAIGYLNNLAYAHGMKAIFQYGIYVGTFGRYDMNAVRRALGESNAGQDGK